MYLLTNRSIFNLLAGVNFFSVCSAWKLLKLVIEFVWLVAVVTRSCYVAIPPSCYVFKVDSNIYKLENP